MRIPLISLFLLLSSMLPAQSLLVEGRVLNKATGEPVAYANIYNISLQKGTISNKEGYFRILAGSRADSVFVSFVGFRKQWVPLTGDNHFHTIQLEAGMQLLSEVVITVPDDSWLRDLLVECRKQSPLATTEARAYYELKSFIQDQQVELVEIFYNVKMTGYDLSALDLKAGRLALKPFNNGLFVSIAGSRAITLLKMLSDNPWFPESPLELSAGSIKKHYYLELARKYHDENSDSIYEISFTPRDTSGLYFAGKVWLNPSVRQILRINLQCRHSKKHPFLPLFNTDRISNVDFDISKNFRTVNGRVLFDHTDFTYNIDYVSRIGTGDEKPYRVATSAVIYAFDYSNLFTIPRFPFKDEHIDDYKKISALPYNDYFWESYNTYRLSDHQHLNERFFNDTSTISNRNLFAQHRLLSLGMFENSFLQWSEERILFKEDMAGAKNYSSDLKAFKADLFNLSVKIFMDINAGDSSVNVLTAAILDPTESFYYLPLDNTTHCFINIYFDLFEIERRKFEGALELSDKTVATTQKMYDELLIRLATLKQEYLREVERGTNREALERWNDVVLKSLGIDNLGFFHLN